MRDFDAFFKKATAAGGWWSAPAAAPGQRQRAESRGPDADCAAA